MKFGHLQIKLEILFLKNDTQNVVGKLVPDPFVLNQNWAYLWINSLKCYTVCFFVCPSGGLPKYITTRMLTACVDFIKLFRKTKSCLELISLPHFLHDILTNQILLPDCLYFLRYWAVCVLKLLACQSVTS